MLASLLYFQKKRNTLNNNHEVEIFYVWGIDFMGPFPPSFGITYNLLVVDYVLKWVEAITTQKNEAKIVVQFIHKNIFTHFGTPRIIISNEGNHFCNKFFASLLAKYNLWRVMGKLKFQTEKSRAFWKRR